MIKKSLPIGLLILLCLALLYPVSLYSAQQDKLTVSISGMTCKLCTIAIKKSLSRIKGARKIKVSLKEKKAWLVVPSGTPDQAVLDAISKAGPYKGKILERTPL